MIQVRYVLYEVLVLPKSGTDDAQMYDRLWPIAGNVSI